MTFSGNMPFAIYPGVGLRSFITNWNYTDQSFINVPTKGLLTAKG